MLGVQRGLRVHVFDVVTGGPKPALVSDLGATYHHESLPDSGLAPDIVVECTGVSTVVVDAMTRSGVDGVVCLTGVSTVGAAVPLDIGGLNREVVLQNDVVFGTVNANRTHYEMAADALARADKGWLRQLITRRVPLDRWPEALEHRHGDIKVVIDFAG